MKQLRYICTQPAINYYTWQVEVMIHNFMKQGINPNYIDVVCSYTKDVPDVWRKMQAKYNYVRFFFYEDTRRSNRYTVSIRPHLLKKHFTEHPYLKDDAIMYHDSDIVFTQRVNWNHYLHDDIWYGSNVSSYIGSDYIKSKERGIYQRMCEIVDISEKIPVENEHNTIGAQIIMKNLTVDYWEKVENDSEEMYAFFLHHLKAFPQTPKYLPIQKWTAEMWSILWNAWKFGHTTKMADDMLFAWPMQPLSSWETCKIFHNAGIVPEKAVEERMFYKGNYMTKLPYDIKLEDYDETKCTHRYVQEILETAQRSCLI